MRWKFIISALVGSMVIGVGGELGLRITIGLGTPVLFRVNDLYGSFPRENQIVHRFGKVITTNGQGMRSDPLPSSHRDGELRILFVGDSVAFGTTFVDQADILTQKIKLMLRESGYTSVSVANASSPGWSPENEYKYLLYEGVFSADYVVMVYNTNDLAQKFTPYSPTPLTPTQNPSCALIELWSRYISPRLGLVTAAVDPGSTNDDGPPNTTDVSAVVATVGRTKELVVAAGAQFVILYVPTETRNVKAHKPVWDAAWNDMKAWAVGSGVPVIDTTQYLSGLPADAIYFDGIHLRPEGNNAVAKAFLKWFLLQ